MPIFLFFHLFSFPIPSDSVSLAGMELVSSLICSLSLLLLCNPVVGSVNEEGMALLSLKQSIQESNPEQGLHLPLSTWNSTDDTPCSWRGIACRNGRVVRLSIPNNDFTGPLPPPMRNLSALLRVNLRGNSFSGQLPAELFTSARGLRSLTVSGNSFSGSLPNEIGNLWFLQSLDLSQNSFQGPIPASLTKCRRLRSLNLGQNGFTGPIPAGLGMNLGARLQNLNLSFNRLSGSIPDDIGRLSRLRGTLDLSHNLLLGPIPESLGSLPDNVYIDLSYNNLSGLIPELGGLSSRGPTAFIGNPYLCGPPLKNLCSSSSSQAANAPPHDQSLNPEFPPESSSSDGMRSTKSSGAVVIVIGVGTMVGICVATLLFIYCFRTIRASRFGEILRNSSSNSLCEERKLCFCFSSSPSGKRAQYNDLVPLDFKVRFDLDELLQASAFVLGKSRNGILYKVRICDDGPVLAVRRLGETGGPPQRFKDFQTEVEAISKVRHPNLVTLRAYYWSSNEKLLIYDYIPNGNLASAIHGNAATARGLSWPVRLGIMRGTAKGLAYLHEVSPKRYVHGNLKPTNILLGQKMEPIISDFGLVHLTQLGAGGGDQSPPCSRASSSATPPCYSPNESAAMLSSYYRAPEATFDTTAKASQKWDVFSFGVIMLQLISGKSTQLGSSGMDLAWWIHLCIDEESKPISCVLDPCLARELDEAEEEIALEVLNISMACVQESPQSRPTMKQVSDALHRFSIPAH